MANEVKLTIRVGDDGTLNVVAKNAKKAEGAIEGVGDATRRTTKARDKYSKSEKGVAGATSNSTKAFSKMTTGIQGGLVPAYATLAANVFAVTAAFGVLSRAAAVKQLNEGLIFTGRAAGQNLPLLVDSLRDITGAAVSSAEAMRTVAVGVSAGFSQTQLEGLTRVAKGASLALGRDMTDAMDRLTRGAAKLEPEILDELGIMVRLDDATETFAATMGKTASELSQFERRMAFTNAIIEQGTSKFAALSAVVDPNPYDKLAAAFDNLSKTLLGGLNTAFAPFANFLADNLGALIGLFGVFATGVIKQAVPALTQGGEAAADMAAELADSSKATIAQAKSFKGAPKIFDKYADAVSNGTASQQDMDKATSSLTKSINLHKSQMPEFIKKHGESSDAVQEKQLKLNNAEKALASITTAQTLETQATIQATKADALNAAATGKLKTAVNLAKTAIMQEWAATMLSVKGKGFLTVSLAKLSAGFRIAAFSARVFGIALLQAIPVIGQIILVASIAYSVLKDFFTTPPTALDEALEANKKRFEEFPNVIRQMNKAIAAAQTQSEQFLAALKPTTGILNQIAEASASLLVSQENEQIERIVKAQEKRINAEQRLAKAKDAAEKAGLNPNEELGFWDKVVKLLMADPYAPLANAAEDSAISQVLANSELEASVQAVADAQIELNAANEELGQINPLETYKGVNLALTRGIATFQTAKIAVADNAEAVELLNQKIGGLQSILDNLTEDNLAESIKALQKLSQEQQAVSESADAAKDAVQNVTELFAKSARPSGVLANHMEALGTAINEMNPGQGFDAIMEKYGKVFEAYGVAEGDTEALKKTLTLFEEVNTAAKERAENNEIAKRTASEASAIGMKALGLEKEIEYSKKLQGEYAKEARALAIAGEEDLARAALLAKEKEITKERAKQLALLKQQTLDDTRRGGDIMGGGSSFGSTVNAAELVGITSVKDGLIALNMASQDSLKVLKELGPEGAAYAAIIGGALNAAEQWSVSLQIIGDKSKDTYDKMAAGMQAVGATINALRGMQKANADAAVAGVDRQIKAEQKRDGKSKESLAKIAALEKKKDSIKRKAFEQDKKMKMAEVVMATGVAIMNSVKMGLPWGAVFGAMAAAMGAAQLSAISSSQYDGGAGSTPDSGGAATSITLGQRKSAVDLATSQSARGELAYFRGESGTGGPANFTPAFSGYRNRAEGGNTAFMVGEQGPELFVPEVPGRIVPNDDVSSGGPTNVSFNISTVDATGVEDLLVAQTGNIIAMIRQAANSYGQDFVESVDTSVFTQSAGGASRY